MNDNLSRPEPTPAELLAITGTHDAILNSMGAMDEGGTSLEKAKKAITQHGVDIPTIGDAIGHVVAGAKNSGTVTPSP